MNEELTAAYLVADFLEEHGFRAAATIAGEAGKEWRAESYLRTGFKTKKRLEWRRDRNT